jgi:hypothetical protein
MPTLQVGFVYLDLFTYFNSELSPQLKLVDIQGYTF